jgi:hypothetical protein
MRTSGIPFAARVGGKEAKAGGYWPWQMCWRARPQLPWVRERASSAWPPRMRGRVRLRPPAAVGARMRRPAGAHTGPESADRELQCKASESHERAGMYRRAQHQPPRAHAGELQVSSPAARGARRRARPLPPWDRGGARLQLSRRFGPVATEVTTLPALG